MNMHIMDMQWHVSMGSADETPAHQLTWLSICRFLPGSYSLKQKGL